MSTTCRRENFGPWVNALGYVWDVPTLEVVLMEQPVIEGGTIVVGTVDQGAAGLEPWPVSISSIALPSGASTAARQDTGNTSLASIDGKITAVNTGAVVIASSALPSGASTGAKQDTLQTAVDAINTKTPALGQAVAGSSTPVVLPAAQITTLTPPAAITGYALEAGHLAAIDTSTAKIPALGQALAAGSVPVVLPAAQITTLTPLSTLAAVTSITNPVAITNANLDVALSTRLKPADTLAAVTTVGTITNPVAVTSASFATSAKQDTGNTSLSNLDTKTPALGQALAAASTPVVLTAAQMTTLTPLSTITANAGTNLNTSSLSLETTQVAMSAKLPATLGQKAMTASLPVVIASNQSTVPVSMAAASVLFKGRANTFRTPGRAGTAGQKILSLHNATGSPVVVSINKVFVDLMQTVIKAITVAPPVIRCWKVTVLPTNGTALTKTKIGGTSSSNAAVTVLGDASADGTGSGTTLTATLPAGTFITQEFAPRFVTAAGYEMADRVEFFGDTTVELQALEGIVLFLDYTLATQNPTTDMWVAGLEWTEV